MKIRQGKPEEAERIVLFLRNIFDDGSIATYCNNLREKLENQSYVSMLVMDDDKIIGHSGIAVKDNVAIFNTLGVSPEYRGLNISKELLLAKIAYASGRKDLTHAVGYCVLHHPRSEKIHDDTFKPIGLMPVPGHFLADSDPLRKNSMFNGNLVVCKQLRDFDREFVINYGGILEEKISRICSSIGIKVRFSESECEKSVDLGDYVQVNLDRPEHGECLNFMEGQGYAFLGMFPNVYTGFMAFGFMQRKKVNVNDEIPVSNDERRKFVEEVLRDLRK